VCVRDVKASIGYPRSEFALREFPKASDDEMLERGTGEKEIQKLWTPDSILAVRVFLWLFCTATLACFVAATSVPVYQHAFEKASRAGKVAGAARSATNGK
jgi:hypothetical protein